MAAVSKRNPSKERPQFRWLIVCVKRYKRNASSVYARNLPMDRNEGLFNPFPLCQSLQSRVLQEER